jgi:hypothetical protein
MCVLRFETRKTVRKTSDGHPKKAADPLLCPVQHWVTIIHYILRNSPKGHAEEINFYQHAACHQGNKITAKMNTKFLRDSCRASPQYLGYEANQIRARSVRSGIAMALFLVGVTAEEIRLLGHWKSNAVIDYIQPQIISAFAHLSTPMTRSFLLDPPGEMRANR